jgi:transcriptional regulator with XRE-family HTH domain
VGSYLVADLRGIRVKHGIGVREAAKASGISPATISRMEMGFSPDIGTALKASIFYGLPLQEIWKLP